MYSNHVLKDLNLKEEWARYKNMEIQKDVITDTENEETFNKHKNDSQQN